MSSSIYQIWLTHNNGAESIRLPVVPESFNVRSRSSNTIININGLGEVVRLGDPRSLVFNFSSQFPSVYGPFCEYVNIPDPIQSYELILGWKNSKNPSRLIITGILNIPVSIENFDIVERGGDIGTLYYNITLRQYRFVREKRINIDTVNQQAFTDSEAQREDLRETPDTYIVRPGDSLWRISQRLLGDGDRWREIATKNNLVAQYIIQPGQELRIC